MSIVIVDYGMGNLSSVYNALLSLKADALISSTPSEVDNASKLILPGVGSFPDAIKGLEKRNLIDPIKRFLTSGKVYLGICLGLQILFEKTEEGNAKGLGIFKGDVRHFQKKKGFKIPHMGWNSVNFKKSLKDIKNNSYFYFVHSYYVQVKDKNVVSGTTEYAGERFTSMISKDNIYAVQFHPEKSQEIGLKFLKSFLRL